MRHILVSSMQHNVHQVDILNEQGAIISTKRRIDVQKTRDIYHTIHVLLVTPLGEVVVSTIPLREDLPNLYAGKIGTTVATIRRTGESASEAAQRAVSRELFIDEMPLTRVGERMYRLPSQRLNFMTVFYGVTDVPESYSLLDIDSLIVMSPKEIDRMIRDNPDEVAESLTAVWQDCRAALPI